tara:strand:+ start:1232 stop:2005 length:774 start_codon:yes stop_codon:yes gene_type:complete
MQPTRFEIDGVRHYRTGDDPNKYYPSVTAILGRTATEKDNASLLSWQLRNPGGREAAAQRGSAVHLACEKYIRGLPTEISDEHRPFWDGLAKHLDKYDYFIWSEKPLDPRWRYCTGEDGISRIWSHDYQYCGCPDLVGVRNGVTILSDFKTSVGPYNRYFPDKSEKDRTKYTGWKKFFKCGIQLAAYAIAIQETLGVKIDAAQILVSTPEIDQNFLLHGNDLVRFRHKWLVKVRKYQELIETERQEAPERELVLVAA